MSLPTGGNFGLGYTICITDPFFLVRVQIAIIRRAAQFKLPQPCFCFSIDRSPGTGSVVNFLRGWE
jgi:hypothetical protein